MAQLRNNAAAFFGASDRNHIAAAAQLDRSKVDGFRDNFEAEDFSYTLRFFDSDAILNDLVLAHSNISHVLGDICECRRLTQLMLRWANTKTQCDANHAACAEFGSVPAHLAVSENLLDASNV